MGNCIESDFKAPKASESDDSKGPIINAMNRAFPGAIDSAELANKIQSILADNGFTNDKTLLATSLCCDEVNRKLEGDLTKVYGNNFNMGGLAGFPFGGVTSFGAMAHHIPADGSCLIVYGPHVGIDSEGNVGKINRQGRGSTGACCGSATAAAGYVEGVRAKNQQSTLGAAPEPLDAQQAFVGNMLMPHSDRLATAAEPEVALPYALFDVQDEMMKKIVSNGCGEVAGEGKIILLGGLQINTPAETSEFFLPKTFEIRNNKGETVKSLLYAF